MANRIMGITVEIGGDTTKLQTALKGVNGQIKGTQQQLKDVDKLLNLIQEIQSCLHKNYDDYSCRCCTWIGANCSRKSDIRSRNNHDDRS